MGMDQYLLIPFLVGWTSIYQLFWCSPGLQGFDTLPYITYTVLYILILNRSGHWSTQQSKACFHTFSSRFSCGVASAQTRTVFKRSLSRIRCRSQWVSSSSCTLAHWLPVGYPLATQWLPNGYPFLTCWWQPLTIDCKDFLFTSQLLLLVVAMRRL